MANPMSPSSWKLTKKTEEFLNEDRLTSLPKNAIEAILICLPLKDAVRTSILSRVWRYEWSNLTQLVFDDGLISPHEGQLQTRYDRKLVKIVDQVLLLHQGPIHVFKFSAALASCMDIDRWILFLSRNGIRELTLKKWSGQMYKIPSCLLASNDIIYLELCGFVSIPPASCTGSSNLRTLILEELSFSKEELENLISNCPLLSILKLRHIYGCTHLNLYAPNLVDFSVEDAIRDVTFEKTPLLAKVSINLVCSAVAYRNSANGAICKLIDSFGCLPGIRKLELLGHTYQALSKGDVPVRLPTACHLLQLSVSINFEDKHDLLAALSVFRSSPVLQQVDIESLSDGYSEEISVTEFWEAQDDCDDLFIGLQFLNVTNLIGARVEMKFIEFVLENAPVLEMVHVKFQDGISDANAAEICRKLVRFGKISIEHRNENSETVMQHIRQQIFFVVQHATAEGFLMR